MSQNLATAPIDVEPKRRRAARRSRAAAFTYDLSDTDGLVIRQVAEKVSKKNWADLEFFIHFCQAGARGRLAVTVELRPREL